MKKTQNLVEKYFPYNDNTAKELAAYAARFHDAGKATSFFQEYIKGNGKWSKEKNHSLLSAVILYYYLRKIRGISPLQAFLSFLAVKKHHSFPEDTFENGGIINDIELIKKQLNAISKDNIKELGIPVTVQEVKESINDIIKELKYFRSLRRFKRNFGEIENFSIYTTFLSIYSSLLFSDRKDAVDAPEVSFPDIPYEKFKNLIDSIPLKRPIDEKRQEAKEFVLSKEFNLKQRIYSINLPTGLGKTYTGFLQALKMKKILKGKTGKSFRIIYALPFISIIDQNFEVLKEKLEQIIDSTDSRLILKHHYLSNFEYLTNNSEILPFDIAKVLTEGWESEITITTIVQIFNAIFPKNRSQALRFSRLQNTIIILDEIQTIPVKYWKIFNEIIEDLSKKLDFYIIFMTATKPTIFSNHTELAGGKFFTGLNRYEIEIDLKERTIEEFLEKIDINIEKSHLFILNTVKSSQEIYKKLSETINGEIEYLSRAITPFERRERLKKIREGKVKYLISTQIVEAGVDIDFDVVIRDFAPFDSLNQSAGRCNRNGEKAGLFKIIKLIDENNQRPYWSYIYDPILSSATIEILKDKYRLTEEEFIKLTEKYFNLVKDRAADEAKTVKPFFEAVKYLRFQPMENYRCRENEKFICDMNLIEEDCGEEIFVQLNEEAVEIWNKMIEIVTKLKKGNREAFKDYLQIKEKFYDFVIKVNLNKKIPIPISKELGFYFIPIEELDNYYDKTGLKEPNLIW
ncbi:CRISPR-associated helicase Cas3' [Desulfurobacterium sp.]|uniref:CRISPR-associated helicase Cas3' n=1 Tax=Desulfurobacterium sp. TaxID=2004706 RepID=UPI002604DC6A|nr:CRISPR-associated helicase Cas3' [Desulfurobacterium sp.]